MRAGVGRVRDEGSEGSLSEQRKGRTGQETGASLGNGRGGQGGWSQADTEEGRERGLLGLMRSWDSVPRSVLCSV